MKALLISITILTLGSVHGQLAPDSVFPVPESLYYRVKQLDQFMERFNNEDDELRKSTPVGLSEVEQRSLMVAALFNSDWLMKQPNVELAKEFVNEVSTNDIFLQYSDEPWFALVKAKVKIDGKEKLLTLTMQYDGNPDQGFRWLIAGVRGDFIVSEDEGPETIIPPTNHNVDFMDMIRIVNQEPERIETYTSHSELQITQFIELVKLGKIQVIHTYKPTYHFLQIPGWIFTVDLYNRDSNNSGWLISNLFKSAPCNLNEYFKNNLNLE